jgi:Rrf2 family transcriptional regulator, nitric oxide-sensitive transcriptional repressor
MRLTLQTDYALRVLLYLGLKRDELATVVEMAQHFDMSKGHVMKVVNRLAQLGYVQTLRGKNGGIRLAREPNSITAGAVVRAVEPELGVLGCLQERNGYCRIEGCCTLRSALREATDAFLAMLDRYTLADLIEPQQALSRLLQINVAAGEANGASAPA